MKNLIVAAALAVACGQAEAEEQFLFKSMDEKTVWTLVDVQRLSFNDYGSATVKFYHNGHVEKVRVHASGCKDNEGPVTLVFDNNRAEEYWWTLKGDKAYDNLAYVVCSYDFMKLMGQLK